ncbi:MAG: ester cyclase [Flavobacteriales bacterium]|nr:ester cyclase [Flavobacteriales bacterium]
MRTKLISTALFAAPFMLLYSCGGGGHDDGRMAEHMAMMKADSSKHAMEAANMECLRKVFAMFETGDVAGMEDCVAENMIENSPVPGITSTGIQALRDVATMHHGAFPDTKITVISMVADGDMVYAHYNMKGTNTGAMGPDMPATGKTMDVNGVDIVRFENGKGAEHWGYWEEMKMMEQMGMMPAPGDQKKK